MEGTVSNNIKNQIIYIYSFCRYKASLNAIKEHILVSVCVSSGNQSHNLGVALYQLSYWDTSIMLAVFSSIAAQLHEVQLGS